MSSLHPPSSRPSDQPADGVVQPHPAMLALGPNPTSAGLRGAQQQQRQQPQQHPPDEDEDEQLRMLEEEILAEAAKRSVKWTTSTHQRWRQRILAVAAFKTEGEHRRHLENDILALADALAEDDEGVAAAAVLSRGGGGGGGGRLQQRQQLQGRRTEALISRGASSASGERPAAAALSRSAPGSVSAHSVFTQAEEDEMDMIVGLSGQGV